MNVAGADQSHIERTSSFKLERGLYALRYENAAGEPPLVHVRSSFGSERNVKIITAPGDHAATLASPGSALVLVVEDESVIQLTIQAKRAGGSLEAEMKIDPLTRGTGHTRTLDRASTASPPTSKSNELRFVCHVARQGDVAATAGSWVAGPQAPAPIEGITIHAPASQGLRIEYQVLVQGQKTWSDWVPEGRFAGTMGNARPLAGLRLRVGNAGSDVARLKGSALFLGSSILEREGTEIELISASGVDPLVGLSIDLNFVPASKLRPPSTLEEPRRRVRVFRAGVEQ